MIKLTGSETKILLEAIISAYPSKDKLGRMVSDELKQNLEVIAGGGNLEEIVFNLIEWTKAVGRLEELIKAAIKGNPEDEKLRIFYESISDRFNHQ